MKPEPGSTHRTERVKSPGLLLLGRARKLPSTPRVSRRFSASTPVMFGWNHLDRKQKESKLSRLYTWDQIGILQYKIRHVQIRLYLVWTKTLIYFADGEKQNKAWSSTYIPVHTKSYTNTRIRPQELRFFSKAGQHLSFILRLCWPARFSSLLASLLPVPPFSQYSQSVFTMTCRHTQLAVCGWTMSVLKHCIFVTLMMAGSLWLLICYFVRF